MNKIKIFENPSFQELKEYEKEMKKPYGGYVYVHEWQNCVKIGQTEEPSQRFTTLCAMAKYANQETKRFAISCSHTNCSENEKRLHFIFDYARRDRTELFDVSFDDVLQELNNLRFDYDTREQELSAKRFKSMLKNVLNIDLHNKLTLNPNLAGNDQNNYLLGSLDRFYIKPFGMHYRIPLDSHSVYTRCSYCGKEIELSFGNLIDAENNGLDFDLEFLCEDCFKDFKEQNREIADMFESGDINVVS